jgi:prepilin-type N-terminal cleavage/methylation domain-containing protein
MRIPKTKKKGFTLVELLITITIISMLSSVVIVSLSSARTRAKTAKSIAQLRSVNDAVQAYYAQTGSYPVSSGWQGYCSYWGADLGDNWIPELAAAGIGTGILPTDPRNGGGCFSDTSQYIYVSNGTDFKLISHSPESLSGVPSDIIDPLRPTWAFGFWSSPTVRDAW